jgi:hypothetical protein
MALKDITITGSIGSYPTLSYGQKTYISSTDEQSFPIEQFTGSAGGTTPNFNGQYSTTDLFVNVTQSWTGSIDTQVGIVDFTHDTQEEFINGEYSGSGIEVTHQRLIGEDCIQLLNVSTVPISYKPFFYVAINLNTPFVPPDPDYVTIINNFLNSNTSPNPGEVYILSTQYLFGNQFGVTTDRKITHIKVNKFDEQGDDNTLSLQELNSLRILFSDFGIIDFPILSITEYPTYYLYSTNKTLPGGNTESIDNNVLDYHLSASAFSTPFALSTPNLFLFYPVNSYTVSSSGTANSFDPSTGVYSVLNTNNIPITFTSSFTINNPNPTPVFIGVYGANPADFFNPIFPSGSTNISVPNGTHTYSITSSQVYLRENNNLQLLLTYFPNGASSPAIISNLQWIFTQSVAPYSSSNITVLSPYLIENFEYSDCNVLINNATNLEYNSDFYKVNYDTGLLIPTNQQQILNRTAEIAPVKPYNYSLNAQILPRYNGVRVTQQNENVWTEGDISPSKTPSVQLLSTYFAYFEWMGGTNYELDDKFAASIKYLINNNGDVLSANISSSYYYNLIDNFETGQKVNLILYSDLNSISNIGESKTVLRAGAIPWGIIASQTGSGYNIQSSMKFGDPNSNIPNYFSVYTGSAPFQTIPPNLEQVINPRYAIVRNNTQIYTVGLGGQRGITITNPSNLTQVAVQANLKITLSQVNPGAPSTSYPITLRIYRSTDGGATYTQVSSQFNTVTYGAVNNVSILSAFFPAQNDDRYYFSLYNPSSYYAVEVNNGLNGNISTYVVLQNPPASAASASISVGDYWETGSLSKNILTGSQFYNIYDPGSPLTQQNYSSSGYFDFLPFTLQIGDQIRFEGDETQVFEIYNIDNNTANQALYLTLSRNILDGTDLNSFLIRRYHPHPNFITLDWNGNGYTGGSGFIIPEYTSDNVIRNFDNVIIKLKEKNII